MAPVKTKRKSQHLPNSNYLSEGHLTIKSRTMVEHWTENSKDLSEKNTNFGGGGCLQGRGLISFKLIGTLPFKWNLVGKRTIFGLWKMKFYFFVILVFSHINVVLKFVWLVNVTRDLGGNNVLFGTQLAAIKVQTTLDLSFLNGKQTMNNIQTLTAKNWV